MMTARVAGAWSMPLEETSEREEQKEEDFFGLTTWSLASFVSLVPYTGFMAWILLSIVRSNDQNGSSGSQKDSPDLMDPTMYYNLLGCFYSLPLVFSGFDLNEYNVSMFLLSIVHIQLERVARTERSWLLSFRPQLPWELSTSDRPSLLQQQPERVGLQEADEDFESYESSRDEEEELQLKQFDRLLLERSRTRESLGKLRLAVEAAGFVLDEGWRVEIKRIKGGRHRTVYLAPEAFQALARTYPSIPSVVKAHVDVRSK